MYTVTEYQNGRPARDVLKATNWRGLMCRLRDEVWWSYGDHRIEMDGEELGPCWMLVRCLARRRAENYLRMPRTYRTRTDLPSVGRQEFVDVAKREGW